MQTTINNPEASPAAPGNIPSQDDPYVLTVKVRLIGADKAQFRAIQNFYGISEKKLAVAAVRHFLDSVRTGLPKLDAR